MSQSWIGHAIRRGIVTTRYPADVPQEEELPPSGSPPTAADDPSSLARGEAVCPTKAIAAESIDQGRCIRCARCYRSGLQSLGRVDANVGSRDELLWAQGIPPVPATRGAAPLRAFERSVHVFVVDVGSCQGCNLEVMGIAGPRYDAQRLGIFFTNSPRHADLLIVVGVPTPAMIDPLRRTWEAMPSPKAVLAVGACAIDGGLFAEGPVSVAPVRSVVPVDMNVAGCPPPPLAILEGILRLTGRGRDAPREDR